MLSISDGELHHQLMVSNISSFDYDKYIAVLDAILRDYEMEPADVLALSRAWGLVVVCRAGVVRGDQRGMFKKRVEVGELIRYESVDTVVREQRQPRGRESWLKLVGEGGRSLAEICWAPGGPVEIADAARERDRIYEAILAASRAPRPRSPETGPAIAEFGSKREFLLVWGQALLQQAGVEPTPALVEEHAAMAAGAVQASVFGQLGARRGFGGLGDYFPDGGMPDGPPFETFEPLYERVVMVEGGPQAVDPHIADFLDNCWPDWVEGARAAHG